MFFSIQNSVFSIFIIHHSSFMPKTFTPENTVKAQELLTHYPEPSAAILPMFHLAEAEFGLINEEAEKLVAKLCQVSQARAHSVWTFYHMYARTPRGKYHIRVCHNITCSLLGAEHIIETLKSKLGLKSEGTTEDGLFSLERVECLGACGGAPSMLVNEELYENLTEEKVEKLLDELHTKEIGNRKQGMGNRN
jgi:NADH-quinone oxidoreductase E subunit